MTKKQIQSKLNKAWDARSKLYAEGDKLCAEGRSNSGHGREHNLGLAR